jgi:hypothetical protein
MLQEVADARCAGAARQLADMIAFRRRQRTM